MRPDPLKNKLFGLLSGLAAAMLVGPTAPGALADEHFGEIPPWLEAHVGDGDGQIADLVLKRARAYYMEKVLDGSAKNACYFAMDATKPSVARSGKVARVTLPSVAD